MTPIIINLCYKPVRVKTQIFWRDLFLLFLYLSVLKEAIQLYFGALCLVLSMFISSNAWEGPAPEAFIWLGMTFGCKVSGSQWKIPLCYLHCISAAVISSYSLPQWLMKGHKGPIRRRRKNSKVSVLPVLPSFKSFSAALSLTSFYSFIPPLVFICVVLCPLAFSMYPWRGDLADTLSSLFLSQLVLFTFQRPPFPRALLEHVCFCLPFGLSSVEVRLLCELRWKDCLGCAYRKRIHTLFSQNAWIFSPGFNRCLHTDFIPVICLRLTHGDTALKRGLYFGLWDMRTLIRTKQ